MVTARSVRRGLMKAQGFRGVKGTAMKKPSSRHYRMPHNRYCTLLHQAVRAEGWGRRPATVDPFALNQPLKISLKERIVSKFKRLLGKVHEPKK